MLCSFEPLHQKVCLNRLRVQDTNWPPKKPTNNSSLRAEKRSHFNFKLACGDSVGRFRFGLYKFVDPSATSSSGKNFDGSGGGGVAGPKITTATPLATTTPLLTAVEEGSSHEAALLQHHVVEIA